MTNDAGLRVLCLQAYEQSQQRLLLTTGAGVTGVTLSVQTSFVAYTQGVLVIALGMGTDELFVACLVDVAAAGDVVVVARETEAVGMATDELLYGEGLVAARRTTVNDNQIYSSH